MRLLLLLTGMAVLLSACDSAPPRSSSGFDSYARAAEAAPASLFAGDAAVLSDADIDRILKYKYVPPRQTRIAVLAVGQRFWMGYSDELARGAEDVRNAFTSLLQTSPAVTRAAYLPELLVPEKRTVAYLREAATRNLADTLIVYQASCQTYEKSRVFSANTAKSFCNVEAALLDVRTGIVPFTATATEQFSLDVSASDADSYETRQKAELRAIRAALLKVGNDVVAYFGKG